MKLSLAMIVKNEEEKLARCLHSVKEYVDEIVIIDTGSKDKTKEIALSFGAKVYDYQWCSDFSKARNFSIEKTTGDTVLVMDADFVLLRFDRAAIIQCMEGRNAVGLAEVINSYTDNGKKMEDRSFFGAVFPREARYTGAIHEQIDASYKRIKLPISIFHDGYDNRDPVKANRNIEILEHALKEKNSPYFLYKLAQEYRGIEQHQKAGRLFSDAYRDADRNGNFFPCLVVEYIGSLMKTKEYDRALKIVKMEETRFSDYPEFHFRKGELYMELVLSNPQKYIQYFPMIRESYEKCIDIGENPKYPGIVGMGTFLPMHNLGAFYEVTGDVKRAKICYEAAADAGYEPSHKRLIEIGNR